MRLREIEARIVRLGHQNLNLEPGPHRYTDEERDGLIAVLRGGVAGEPIDAERDAWAVALLTREGFRPGEGGVNLRQIEARIARLEATHRANPFAGMSEEQSEREIAARMDRLSAEHGGDYAATAGALRADPDPASQKAADGFLRYIERQRKRAEYRDWSADGMTKQT